MEVAPVWMKAVSLPVNGTGFFKKVCVVPHLTTQSPAGGTVWESLGGVPLLEEVFH